MAGVMFRASLRDRDEGRIRFPGAEWRGSSLNVVVSEIDGSDFAGQIREALEFLRGQSAAIGELLSHPGAEASLDFGLWKNDGPSQSVSIPAELALVAGRLGLGIDVSFYVADE